MDQQSLRAYLETLAESLGDHDHELLSARLEGLISVFPFNEYEYILSFLMDRGIVSFDEYERLRETYISDNRYLGLFGLAPRNFGQIWGEAHLRDLDSRFVRPTRELDRDYEGQYDLMVGSLRIEVKSSRAINTRIRGEIVSKALGYDSGEPFWMNFQQLKLDLCDVFVFIGVWVDRIQYWVLSNEEVRNHPTRSSQHRGGIEFQIGITHRNIHQFQEFLVDSESLVDVILAKRGAL